MDFKETDIQSEIRGLTRKFAQTEIAPLVDKDEATATFRPDLVAKLGELGLTGIPTPDTYGGAGLGYQEFIIVLEELSAVCGSYAVSLAVSALPQTILSHHGNDKQKEKYIPPLASGKAIGAFSLSEAGSGSDAAALKTKAVKKGKEYIVNGTKLWTTQGDCAETIMLMARTGGPGAKGISCFILEKAMKGFKIGKCEKKMGSNISHTVELILEDVKIPEENLVGNEGDGFKVALAALDGGRITIGATALGLARAALDVAKSHAKEREQFGKPIGEFQGLSFMMADMATELDASRLLVQRAAWLRDNNKPYTAQAAMAKCFATDMAMKVTTDAVQILGGSGYTTDFPVERYMREAKVMQIVEGTNQIQRLAIGRHIMRGQI